MARDGSYFMGDRDYWDDPDLETIQEKAVYAMLWQAHGVDIAGIRPRNDKLEALRSGLSEKEYLDTLHSLREKGKVGVYERKLWIKSVIWRNLAKGNYSAKQMKAVVERIRHCGSNELIAEVLKYYNEKYDFKIPYAYPIHTLCIPIPSETETETETETEAEFSQVVDNLCTLLITRILENKPDRKQPNVKSKSWIKSTSKQIDLMIRKDKRSPDRIRDVIEWCQADNIPRGSGNFCWAQNILSGTKLRKHFDKMELQMDQRTSDQKKNDSELKENLVKLSGWLEDDQMLRKRKSIEASELVDHFRRRLRLPFESGDIGYKHQLECCVSDYDAGGDQDFINTCKRLKMLPKNVRGMLE